MPDDVSPKIDEVSPGVKAAFAHLTDLDPHGVPIKLAAMIQVGLPTAQVGNYAQVLRDFAFEEQVGHSLVVKEPIGVVGAITPWNYPLNQIVAKVAPALAAGCTVVLKPSEVAPLCAFLLTEILDDAGLPAGVFNLVSGVGCDLLEFRARVAAHGKQRQAIDLFEFAHHREDGLHRQRIRLDEVRLHQWKIFAMDGTRRVPVVVQSGARHLRHFARNFVGSDRNNSFCAERDQWQRDRVITRQHAKVRRTLTQDLHNLRQVS